MARRCGAARASNAARSPAPAAATSGSGPVSGGLRVLTGATLRPGADGPMSSAPRRDQTGCRPHPRGQDKGAPMDAVTIANLYYDAWRLHAGDMSGVPLAEDLAFTGPVANFEDAEGFRAMARQAGAGWRSFTVRHQFADGELGCSAIDWKRCP